MNRYFFVGIGGSGMLPLAEIVRARGGEVAGSDRSHDQGRMPEVFAGLKAKGIELFTQDGSGVAAGDVVIASAAIEPDVPDIAAAIDLGCERRTRAQLLADLFNASGQAIAVGGTSGKSTVTGMIGHILIQTGRDPTIVNGARMKNIGGGARTGKGVAFVAEADESDGSIALYRPEIAVVTNIARDHKELGELRALFDAFLRRARFAIVNADDRESSALLDAAPMPVPPHSYGFAAHAVVRGLNVIEAPDAIAFDVDTPDGRSHVSLRVPGRHNASNALAAIAATRAAGIALSDSAAALGSFAGLDRRLDVIGTANGVTVIDDFGHNPDKIAATLSTLHAFPGRLLVMFQPHGYGPLRLMLDALAQSFAENLSGDDLLVIPDPVYFGGTTDRSIGSDALAAAIVSKARRAEHIASRDACGDRLSAAARPGDRIVVMGARDDTLTEFAKNLLDRLSTSNRLSSGVM